MSFQIAILKVLAAHPEGQASLADLKRYMAVLASSGPDWSKRMRRLSVRAPGLDIFSSEFVIRDIGYWRITPAGLKFLASIEAPADHAPIAAAPPSRPPAAQEATPSSNVISIVEHLRRRAAA